VHERSEIGGYRLIKRIGMGGMSTVYEAESGDGQRVALKLLHPAVTMDARGRERLKREVRMLQRVKGPYVAEVLDAETDEDEAFIVTELIEGPTLEKDVADNGVYVGTELVELAHQLRTAVQSIHSVGVVHRDIKPSNVMMSPHGPVLIDFGVAQFDDDVRLTTPGSVTHTPGYCDPKVLAGAAPDEQADWWALAAVMAYAATGRHPFGAGSAPQIMRRVIDGKPDLSGLAPRVAEAFERALTPDVAHRSTFDQLVEVLQAPNDVTSRASMCGAQEAATQVVTPPQPQAETGVDSDTDEEQLAAAPTEVTSVPTQVAPAPTAAYPASGFGQPYDYGFGSQVFPPAMPQPPQELPAWARPARSARAAVALIGAAVIVAAAHWPIVVGFVYAAMFWLAATVGAASIGLRDRRIAHGGRYKREHVGVAFRLPGNAMWGAISTVLNVLFGLFFGVALMWAATLLRLADARLIVLSGAAVTVVVSWLSGNAKGKEGARRIFAVLAPTRGYRAFWSVLLGAVVVALLFVVFLLYPAGVDWMPLAGTPFFME
jgi:serine/threonine protein kinase